MNKTKILTRSALVGALLFVIMKSLSNILYLEAITLSIVTISLIFDLKENITSILIFSFLLLLISGFNIWNISYLIIYLIYAIITSKLKNVLLEHFYLLIIYGFLLSFLTGQLVDLPFILFDTKVTMIYILAGLKTSIIQAFLTSLQFLLIFKPLYNALLKVKETSYER